jgi:metal transporter CNNM
MLGSGDEAITYRKAELKTFVALGVEDKLGDDELGLLGSVLEFSEKEVSAIMESFFNRRIVAELMRKTPTEDMYCLSAERIVVRISQR